MTDPHAPPVPGPAAILDFWLGAGPDKWYAKDDAFDAEIAARFGAAWEQAARGAFDESWATGPEGALALIVLLDQVPRNIFREDPRAYASDERARTIACYALDRGWDLRIAEPERQFVYMPFMHSERLTDQDHCVRLMAERMTGTDNLLHARVHREIIRRYNRFPYRNAPLGRRSTPAEEAFLAQGGYGQILRELQDA